MTENDEIDIGIKKLRRRKQLPLITFAVFLPVLILLYSFVTNDALSEFALLIKITYLIEG